MRLLPHAYNPSDVRGRDTAGSRSLPEDHPSVPLSPASHHASDSAIGRRLLFTLALLSALGPLAIDAYLPGFTAMAEDLDTPASTIQLTLTAFLFGLALGQLVIGTLSDRYGRRRPLLIAMSICTLAGIGCALAPAIELLVPFRFVQGFTGAAGVVIARSIVRDLTDGRAAVRAFSLLTAIGSFAPVVAPLLGGALMPLVDWRGVLGAVALITGLMVVTGCLFVRESLPVERRTDGGIGTTIRIAAGLFANRQYVGYLLTTACTFGALFAYISASPFMLQNVFRLSSGAYSLAFTFNSVGLIVASATNARIASRVEPATILFVAQIAMSLVILMLGLTILTGVATIVTVLPMTFLFVVTIGFTIGNASALALTSITRAIGTAAAVLGALQFAFGALTSPLVGLGGEGTATPMVIVMGVCTTMALLTLSLTRRAATRAGASHTAVGDMRLKFPRKRNASYSVSAALSASAIVVNGSTSVNGWSSSATAPYPAYQRATSVFFASISSATPPTSMDARTHRRPAARSNCPPSPRR